MPPAYKVRGRGCAYGMLWLPINCTKYLIPYLIPDPKPWLNGASIQHWNSSMDSLYYLELRVGDWYLVSVSV